MMHVANHSDQRHVSVAFYRWQSMTTLTWWLLVWAAMKKSPDVATNESVITRPTWLPSQWLISCRTATVRRLAFRSIACCGNAGRGSAGCRMIAGPNLGRSCNFAVPPAGILRGMLARGYPLLYIVWAMCLPAEYASAVSLGIATHFVASTGISKLWVGSAAWLGPATMRFYLTAYNDAKTLLSRPLLPSWNRWIVRWPWACRFIAVSTIVLLRLTMLTIESLSDWKGSIQDYENYLLCASL